MSGWGAFCRGGRRGWRCAFLVGFGVSMGVNASLNGNACDGAAQAAEPSRSSIEVSVIHAMRTDSGAAIDPRLRDLPQLTREEPFVRYNVYSLLERKELSLETGKAATDPLVNGRLLELTLLDVTDRAGQKRFHLRAAIDEPGAKPLVLEVTAGKNEPFFVAGQSYRGGTLFLELRVL
jgi:hypothetical protein